MSESRATTLDVASVALVARLAVIVHALAEPVWDGHYYDVGARRIAAGLGYSEDLYLAAADGTQRVVWHPWAHYPVGYPGFLAIFHRLLGTSPMVAPVANALTGAALAAVTHRLALRAFGERRALFAGLLVALHPGLVLYSGALMSEPLAALLMMLAIAAVAFDEKLWRGALLSGVALGLATLVRPNAILLAPFLGFVAPPGARSIPRALGRAVVVSALSLLTVAPWTVRNCRVMDACAFVSTNAGWNLVIGSAPGATGKFEFLVGHNPEGAPTCAEGGQVAQDRCWMRYGIATIERDTVRWLKLVPKKLHHTLDAEWFPINYLREARPDRVSAELHVRIGRVLTIFHHVLVIGAAIAAVGWSRRARDRLSPFTTQLLLFAALVALAAYGIDAAQPMVWPLGVAACVLPFLPLPGAPRRDPVEHAVAAVVLTTLVTHAIFFGEDRYHLVATPALAFLMAGLGRRST